MRVTHPLYSGMPTGKRWNNYWGVLDHSTKQKGVIVYSELHMPACE